jgi:hypothetical protein
VLREPPQAVRRAAAAAVNVGLGRGALGGHAWASLALAITIYREGILFLTIASHFLADHSHRNFSFSLFFRLQLQTSFQSSSYNLDFCYVKEIKSVGYLSSLFLFLASLSPFPSKKDKTQNSQKTTTYPR